TLTPTICPTDSTQQYIIMIEDPLGCAQSVTDTVIVVLSYNSLVWPGDANDDLIANNLDLLPIGLYYGASELQRDSVSNLWIGHASLYWTDTLFNGSNMNHADCNGDGIINDADTLAVHLNYNLTHQRSGGINTRSGEPILHLQPDKNVYLPGDSLFIDVLVGDINIPVVNFYGIAFDLDYDNTLFKPESAVIIYPNSFLGTTTDHLKLSKDFFTSGKIDGAIVKKDQIGVNGFGKIAE